MVVGKPYIHFTINNEPLEVETDYNYTWATTVETTKGPINQPVLIGSAAQAQALFGVDMRPYFAQGAESLIMVRVAPPNAINKPTKGVFSFVTEADITIKRATQAELRRYGFISYSSAEATEEWGRGIVEETGVVVKDGDVSYTQVVVKTNAPETSFEGKTFFINSNAQVDGATYELYTKENANADIIAAGIFVKITKRYINKLYYYVDESDNPQAALIPYTNEQGVLIPESYVKVEDCTAECTAPDTAQIFKSNEVLPYFTESEFVIPKGTPLFNVTTRYEGDYGITVSIRDSVKTDDSVDSDINSYDIILTDPSLGTIRMNNVYDVVRIVNRINDRGFNFVAKASDAGLAISEAMEAATIDVDKNSALSGYPDIITRTSISGQDIGSKKYAIKEGDFIQLRDANKAISYSMNLVKVVNQYLSGSSNGEWDDITNRIPADYRGDAHAAGLKLLRRLRIAGIFCMYGDESIQLEYTYHGKDPIEPEKGMNNNETCKWRTILLGASSDVRGTKAELAAEAYNLNDQYTLFLGQGLIDTGYDGIASGKTSAEKRRLGVYSDHQLLPYECTQYIAGLRSKLSYDESIFGGQGRKRIRSLGDLEIAPLFDNEDAYEWDPQTYTYLNERGVLTFTEEYGNITLTDGVTTCQTGYEEDEEGVMNILKYAQNSVYNVCLPYIGRNINSDLEQSITMDIQNVLETMKSGHQSIVDTDEYQAYTVNVSLGSRANQLLGRIYVYLTITPAHALRQIEVEMTVQ